MDLAVLIPAVALRKRRIVTITLLFLALGIGGGLIYSRTDESFFVRVKILGWYFDNESVFAYIGAVFASAIGLGLSALTQRAEHGAKNL